MSNFQTFFTGMADVKQAEANLEETKSQTAARNALTAANEATRQAAQAQQDSIQRVLQEAFTASKQPQQKPLDLTAQGETSARELAPPAAPTLPSLVDQGMSKQERDAAQETQISQTRGIADKLTKGGMSLLQQGQPKAAIEVLKEATALSQQADSTEKEQWAQRKGHIEQFAQVLNTVDSQQGLDQARQVLNQLEPGAGDNLPHVYDAYSAPVIRRAGLMASSALQQVEVKEKLVDLQTREQNNKSVIEHRNMETAKLRADVQKKREGISVDKRDVTLTDKSADAVTKENMRYNKELDQAELRINKEYGRDRQPSWLDKITGKSAAEINAEKGDALAQEQARIKATHESNLKELQANLLSKRGSTPGAAKETAPAPMPTSKAALRPGQVYNTPRGKAKWNGTMFEAVQ